MQPGGSGRSGALQHAPAGATVCSDSCSCTATTGPRHLAPGTQCTGPHCGSACGHCMRNCRMRQYVPVTASHTLPDLTPTECQCQWRPNAHCSVAVCSLALPVLPVPARQAGSWQCHCQWQWPGSSQAATATTATTGSGSAAVRALTRSSLGRSSAPPPAAGHCGTASECTASGTVWHCQCGSVALAPARRTPVRPVAQPLASFRALIMRAALPLAVTEWQWQLERRERSALFFFV